MKLLLFPLLLGVLFGSTTGFYVDLISRIIADEDVSKGTGPLRPSSDFTLSKISDPKLIHNVGYFFDAMLNNVTFALSTKGFIVVSYPQKPFVLDRRKYYWRPSYHPPLEKGKIGCKIEMKTLVGAAENLVPFDFNIAKTNLHAKVTVPKFLKNLYLDEYKEPAELSWYCKGSNLSCCELSCCSPSETYPNQNATQEHLAHHVFVYTCLSFLALCITALLGSMAAFVFKDVWHRYFSWFPSTPRASSPRVRSRQLTPTATFQRSPSLCHLTV